MFELSVFLRDRLIGRSTFNDDEVRIGRSADNEVQIDNLALSRYHASIETINGTHVVKDWQSQNGTFVNGDRINGKRALDDGDRIGFGKFVLVYRSDKIKDPAEQQSKKARDNAAFAVAGETLVGQVAAEVKRRPCPHVGHLEPQATGNVHNEPIPLPRDVSVLGSGKGCEIPVPGAAERGAAIIRGWTGFAIIALSAGFKVRGEPLVDTQPLFTGDEIRCGSTVFRFHVTRLEVGP